MGDFFFLVWSINIQPELSIIKLFLDYSLWDKYSSKLTSKDFPDELQSVYLTLDSFHKTQNESHSNIHLLDLANIFFASKPKDIEYYNGVFDTLKDYQPNEETVSVLIKSIRRSKLLRQLSLDSYSAAEGKKSHLDVTQVLKELEEMDSEAVTEEDFEFVTDDLETLANGTIAKPGLRWRLNWLNRALGSLRRGDFGFLFARPETGKTTFLASEVSFMAEQLSEEDGPIIWFKLTRPL